MNNEHDSCEFVQPLGNDRCIHKLSTGLLSTAVVLVWLAPNVAAQSPLPQNIVDSWREGGCQPIDIWVTDSGFRHGRAVRPKEAELIPAFIFSRCQRLAHLDKRPRLQPLRNLPIPPAPFGLFLSVQNNDDFKDIERFHGTLHALNLERNIPCEIGGPENLDLKLVGKVAALRHLVINGWSVSDKYFEDFAKLRHLHTLVLIGTVVTHREDDESRAANHRHFQRLGSTLTDAGIERLSELEDLETLSLGYSNITDQGLKVLTGFKNLKVLRLQHNSLSDESLRILAACETLEVLDLSDTQVTGTGLQFLSKLPRLSKVVLNSCPVSRAGADVIASLPHIERLSLRRTPIADDTMAVLAKAPDLRWIDLFGAKVTEAGVKQLTGSRQIQVLGVPTPK